jgi:hypothetical protein
MGSLLLAIRSDFTNSHHAVINRFRVMQAVGRAD